MTDVGSVLEPEVVLKKTTIITVTAEPLEFAPWVYFWMAAEYPNRAARSRESF